MGTDIKKEITIGIAGAAGDGLDKTGDTLARTLSRLGLHSYAYNSYQSLIRGGHTWLRVRVGEQKVISHGDHLNAVIALNQDSFERHAPELEPGGVILYNSDKVTYDTRVAPESIRGVGIPFKQLTKDLGKLLPVMQNTSLLGALIYLMDLEFEVMAEVLADTFKHKGQEIIDQNVSVARLGYDFAKEQGASLGCHWTFSRRPLPFVTGNMAFGIGATAAGLKFYAAYPMSPASSILDWFIGHGVKVGVMVKQAEDEISVANLTIGAGHAGVRAMCATSGGGFALMTEAIGMAGMIETPAVFINVMRGGPSTGIPTKTEQADLNQAIGASQGDFPRAIMAPSSVTDAFYTAAEALNIAEKYQIPVILLSDLLLGEHTETIEPDAWTHKVPIERGEMVTEAPESNGHRGYLRYKITKSGVSPRALPGTPGTVYVSGTDEHDEEGWLISDEHTNASMRRVMADKRMRKMEGVLRDLPAPELFGPADADVTLIGWGSTWGAIRESLDHLANEGISANHLHIKYLVPFHEREIRAILDKAKKTVVIENSAGGQFARHLRAETGFTVDHTVLKYNGEPFEPREIAGRVKRLVQGQPDDGRVTQAEAREIAYHYSAIYMAEKARPVRLEEIAANGHNEPVWAVEMADRKTGETCGELLIGRETGATYELRTTTGQLVAAERSR